MIGRLRQLSEPRLRQQAGIEKSETPVDTCPMGEKIKSHILPSKPKGKEVHTQTDKRSRTTRTVNRMNSFFQTGGYSAALIENSSNIYLYMFSSVNNKTISITGNCYSGDQIVRIIYTGT